MDPSNNAYITVSGDSRVYRISASGDIKVLAGSGFTGYSGDGGAATKAALHSPSGLALDAVGNLYIADSGNGAVRRVDLVSGMITTFVGSRSTPTAGDAGVGSNAPSQSMQSLAIGPRGDYLYIVDSGEHSIRQVNLSTNTISTLIAASPSTLLRAISVDEEGSIYYTDGAAIRQISFSNGNGGTVRTVADTGAEVLSLTLDGSGNLYFGQHGAIGKVALGSGTVTTIMGGRAKGFSGDGGPIATARVASVTGLAADKLGRLWVVDSENLRVRQLSNGMVSTVAGNGSRFHSGDSYSGMNGSFSKSDSGSPSLLGIATDASGNTYIYDGADYTVRKLEAATGTLTTIAGQPAQEGPFGDGGSALKAKLATGRLLAVDAEGAVYLLGGATLRKISQGIITTIAGGGDLFPNAGVKPTDAALGTTSAVAAGANGRVFIATEFDGTAYILKYDPSAQSLTPYAGGASGFIESGPALHNGLQSVKGLASDSAGNLYYSDAQNGYGVVRRISADGQKVTTVAGALSGTRTFIENGPALSVFLDSPTALAVDSAGNLFVNDANGIHRINVANGQISAFAGRRCSIRISACADASGDGGLATEATFSEVSGLAAGAPGSLSILDGARIRQVLFTPDAVDASVSAMQSAAPPKLSIAAMKSAAPLSVVNPIARAAIAGGTTSGPLHYVAMSPCRILDSRNPAGPFGGPILAAGSQRDVPIPAGTCSVPFTAAAYSLNVTVVPKIILGYLSLWPSGAPQPVVSTLNSFDGDIRANAAIVPAGVGGAISIFVTDDCDVIVDINGYFVP